MNQAATSSEAQFDMGISSSTAMPADSSCGVAGESGEEGERGEGRRFCSCFAGTTAPVPASAATAGEYAEYTCEPACAFGTGADTGADTGNGVDTEHKCSYEGGAADTVADADVGDVVDAGAG